jgi:hypothetical protein
MTKRMTTIEVSWPALRLRLDRHLRNDGQAIRAYRKGREHSGKFYLLNIARGSVIDADVDPVQLARSLGLLQPFERCEVVPTRG